MRWPAKGAGSIVSADAEMQTATNIAATCVGLQKNSSDQVTGAVDHEHGIRDWMVSGG